MYVDKTRLVFQLANSFKYVFLSRPRRFGKSLLVSTLEEYFKGNRDLFSGLAIEGLEKEWISYPVMRFDLSAANYKEPQVLVNKIESYLDSLEEVYGKSKAKEIADRFRNVIEAAFRKTGKKVVVLIDEYDKPMLDTMHDDSLKDSLKAELRGFYAVLKECDSMVRFAMLTGVTKFGKVSVFSGLNNLMDISMNPMYNEICGISEKEFHDNFGPSIKIFADTHGITDDEAWERFKAYYDGYHFSFPATDIYNPFSTLHAFADNELNEYWFATGSPSFLIKLIERYRFMLKDLEGERRKRSALSDITDISNDFVPLLYQSGYLTIKGFDDRFGLYTLGFPNKEVSQGFWDALGEYFFRKGDNPILFSLPEFVYDLERGEAESFMCRLQSLFASISSEHEADKEIHFQNMITIFTKMLGFVVLTEVHSSQGRSDIQIETPDYIYIMELKVDSTPEKASAQIKERGYARQYVIDPREKILIGANFSSVTRTLTGWQIERIR